MIHWHARRRGVVAVGLACSTALAGAGVMDLYQASLRISAGTALLAIAGGVASGVGTFWRYDRPRTSVWMIVASCAVSPAAAPGLFVVLYALGSSRRYRLLLDCALTSFAAILVCAALYLWQNATRTTALETLVVLALSLGCATAFAGVAAGRSHSRFEAELRESMRRELDAATKATRDEKTLLSRELHDVIGHRLALLNIFSAGLASKAERIPPDLRRYLTIINENVTEAGVELSELVKVIDARTAADSDLPGVEPRTALFERFRAAGMRLAVRGDPDFGGTTIAHERTLERFCREGLTNALKYAAPGPVVVEVEPVEGAGIEARIRSPYAPPRDAPATPATGRTRAGGFGLRGLQERAALLGGSVWTTVTEQHHTLHLYLPGRLTEQPEADE